MALEVVRNNNCGPQKIVAAVYARVSKVNAGQDPTMQTRELAEYCQRRGLPFASFWLCRSSIGAQLVFWCAPWTAAVWTLLVAQLGGSRFWKGREHVLAWRAAHGGYLGTVCRGAAWMFFGLFASYGAEFAVIFLCQPSATAMHMLPCASYAPVLLALWSASRG